MKKTKIKRKKQNKLNILAIIVILVVLVNIYNSFIKNRTIILENPIEYEENLDTVALILRDEQVYAESGEVSLEGLVNTRVKVSYNIGDISKLTITEMNLENINNIISVIKGDTKIKTDNSNISETVKLIRDEKYKAITEIPTVTNKIEPLEYKDYLLEKYNISKKLLENNGVNTKAMNSGVVSTKVDGYEDTYSVYDMDLENFNLNLNDVNIDKNSKNRGIKIINNNYYGMIFNINGKDIKNVYEKEDSISVKINDEILIGKVVNVKTNNGTYTISAYFDTGFEETKDYRFYDIEVVNYKSKVFEIPKKSVITKDGIKGVYVKLPSGVIGFKPVEIVNTKEKVVSINSGKDGLIKIKDKEVKTVRAFDEIIRNPKRVKEGELVE